MEGGIFSICNPLLDISTHADQALLDQYKLTLGTACLADKTHLPLYDEIIKHQDVEYIAGGASQNTIRAAQWMLRDIAPNVTHYVGCVGNDENGRRLKTEAEKDGVNVHYMVTNTERTGTCAVLVKNHERCLVANLAAANLYDIAHFREESTQKLLHAAKYYYATSFFLTVCPQALVELGQHAAESNKLFAFNIAAPFLVEFFWDKMQEVLPYADVVMCNDSEATAFGKRQGWNEKDLKDVAQRLAALPKKNTQRERMVIFTQGPNPTIVYYNGKVHEFAPVVCPESEIVDLNGAGDAFAGGFMAAVYLNKSVEDCVRAGHYCAWEVIRRSGATFPAVCSFKWN